MPSAVAGLRHEPRVVGAGKIIRDREWGRSFPTRLVARRNPKGCLGRRHAPVVPHVRGHEELWLLLTDTPPAATDIDLYACRHWIEQGFRGLKRGGWQWHRTRWRDPVRVARHLLVRIRLRACPRPRSDPTGPEHTLDSHRKYPCQDIRSGATARTFRYRVATPPVVQQGQDAGQAPEADAVHVQVRHQFPEGLRPLAGGHARRQRRGAAQTDLALPALYPQPPQDDQMAGIGVVVTPGSGPVVQAGPAPRVGSVGV